MTARCLAAAVVLIAVVSLDSSPKLDCGDPTKDVKAADCVAWSIFAAINQSADAGASRDAKWERWIEAGNMFTGVEPVWPVGPPGNKRLERLFQNQMPGVMTRNRSRPIPPSGAVGEVRLNRAVFNLIHDNGLWNKAGLIKAYSSGKDIDFDPDSIQIKAVWDHILEVHKDDYHWQFDTEGHLIGLAALHISSKVLKPNWFWATWKHESGPDVTHDSFGYSGHTMSRELQELFRDNNLAADWLHYRLIGAQTQFVESGNPTKLGNSKIETNASASSCITCHAVVAVKSTGYVPTDLAFCSPCYGQPPLQEIKGLKRLDFVWSFRRVDGQSARK